MPLFPLAIQNAVDVRKLGQATSAAMLFRQIGGVMGTAVMGTVLALSLSAHVPENSEFSFREGHRGGLEALQARFDSLAVRLDAALTAHDDSMLEQALQMAPLPLAIKARLRAAAHYEASVAQTLIRHEIDRARRQVLEQLRQVFAKAIGRIYRFVLVLVVAGLGVTWFVPEHPLRRTYE
ncbi:MAG: hypothetical protein Q9M35_10385 [Rhodothermus sp.]|nr:hypothetical protein [Rhodothermus sp.]